jgi:beta-lactamase class A
LRSRGSFSFLRWGSLLLVLLAVVVTTLQLVRFSRLWVNFPSNMSIANVPVGQLSRQAAAERVLTVYSLPIELYYNDALIDLSPNAIGFTLDTDSMLAAADQERTRTSFWQAYWNYLWDRPVSPINIPLRATYSEDRLRDYLKTEVATRYDQPATQAIPVVGTTNFQPGSPGSELDIDRAVPLIETALFSLSQRSVVLPIQRTSPTHPTFQNLEVLLRQTIDLSGFDGIIGLYVQDMGTGQTINFILDQDEPVSTPPDVAFTASSTIKIPIMISVFRRIGDNLDAETTKNLEDMIARSINTASDWLMQNKIDRAQGPLLQDLYQCAKMDGGALIAAFPGEITQTECQTMINYLIQDRIALLIQAGVPDGTNVAHKHGWVTDLYGVIHDMSDAAIVFTPGGDYVFTVYMYHPVQIVFDPANLLVTDLSRAIYNYYNLPNP